MVSQTSGGSIRGPIGYPELVSNQEGVLEESACQRNFKHDSGAYSVARSNWLAHSENG